MVGLKTKRSVENRVGAKFQKFCPKCRQPFIGQSVDKLCRDCMETIPQCDNCGIVIGAEWGFMESEVDFKGHKICGHCLGELKKKKFLHMFTEGKFMFPDGTIRALSKTEQEKLKQRLIYDNLQ